MPSFRFHLALLCPYSYYCSFQKHAFLASVKHLSGPRRKQKFTLTGSKCHGLWFVIGGFRSVLCFVVLGFVACARYDWRQWKTQLWRRRISEKRSDVRFSFVLQFWITFPNTAWLKLKAQLYKMCNCLQSPFSYVCPQTDSMLTLQTITLSFCFSWWQPVISLIKRKTGREQGEQR